MDDPESALVYASRVDDQFFLGDDLLVAPVYNDDGHLEVYLPKGLWYDFFAELSAEQGGRKIQRNAVPLDRIPVYVRAGAVIPLGPVMQYTDEKPATPLVVQIYSFSDADLAKDTRKSQFALYEDDGLSTSYLQGKFQRTHFRFQQTSTSIRFEIDRESGNGIYQSVAERGYQLRFHGVQRPVCHVRFNGKDIRLSARGLFRPAAHSSEEPSVGGLSIFIPRSELRKLVVEITSQNEAGNP